MSRSAGSNDVWVDPTMHMGGVDWVDPTDDNVLSEEWSEQTTQPEPLLFDLEADQDSHWDHGRGGGQSAEWIGAPVDCDDVSREDASRFLVDMVLDKYNNGKWFATDICKLAYWAEKGGMVGAITELSLRPGLSTSAYSKHVKKVVGIDMGHECLQWLQVPCSDSGDGSRTTMALPVINPHEVLNQEMGEDGGEIDSKLAQLVKDCMVPPVYTSHTVAIASGMKAQPGVLYVDGVPTTKKDGLLGFWVYFLLSRRKKRHLVCCIRKSRMCKCGCRGWCTLFVIFSWLNWSFVAAAAGINPSRTWDEQMFTDTIRLGTAGVELLYSLAMVAIKGDWMEFCSTFAFSNWNTILSPCLACWCTKLNYLDHSVHHKDFTHEDYSNACESCEISVHVGKQQLDLLHAILHSLFYDRRPKGSHGRSLRFAIPGTQLRAGDRLEPTLTLPNVSMLDGFTADDLPVRLHFWRTEQQRVKHRNPIFNKEIGLVPYMMATDMLHAVNMGTLQKFARELLWMMMWCGVWCTRRGRPQDEWIDLSLIAMRSELGTWERDYNKAHPLHKPTIIQKITPGHIGKPTARVLKLKAAETKAFFYFLHWKVQSVADQMHQGELWLQSSNEMEALLRVMTEARNWKLTTSQLQDRTSVPQRVCP